MRGMDKLESILDQQRLVRIYTRLRPVAEGLPNDGAAELRCHFNELFRTVLPLQKVSQILSVQENGNLVGGGICSTCHLP